MSLLALPGELRNRIYDFATDNRHDKQSYNYVSYGSVKSVVPQDQDRLHALSQVCKQLRHETRPLLEATSTLSVTISRLLKLIAAIYPTLYTDDSDSRLHQAREKITILLKVDRKYQNVNLAPLMSLRHLAPNVRLSFSLLITDDISTDPPWNLLLVLDHLINNAKFGPWIKAVIFSSQTSSPPIASVRNIRDLESQLQLPLDKDKLGTRLMEEFQGLRSFIGVVASLTKVGSLRNVSTAVKDGWQAV
ncbi:hypothetical protein NX059_012078 [Plenodomus lindquistii]|nr:hypothetical protein NX059_012078 [Plenodomus lindquistii]